MNHQEKTFKVDMERLQMNEDVAKDLYRDMTLGREFEEMCAQMYYRGKMFGFVHLYSGQEAVSTGVIRALEKRDYICRCVAPVIASMMCVCILLPTARVCLPAHVHCMCSKSHMHACKLRSTY